MKIYIWEMLDDLLQKRNKEFIPPGPKSRANAPTVDLDQPPATPAMPEDLEAQILSKDPAQRVRQLAYQAQKDEERLSG